MKLDNKLIASERPKYTGIASTLSWLMRCWKGVAQGPVVITSVLPRGESPHMCRTTPGGRVPQRDIGHVHKHGDIHVFGDSYTSSLQRYYNHSVQASGDADSVIIIILHSWKMYITEIFCFSTHTHIPITKHLFQNWTIRSDCVTP